MDLIWLPILISMSNPKLHILSIGEQDCMSFFIEETKRLLNFKGIVHFLVVLLTKKSTKKVSHK